LCALSRNSCASSEGRKGRLERDELRVAQTRSFRLVLSVSHLSSCSLQSFTGASQETSLSHLSLSLSFRALRGGELKFPGLSFLGHAENAAVNATCAGNPIPKNVARRRHRFVSAAAKSKGLIPLERPRFFSLCPSAAQSRHYLQRASAR